MILDTRLYDRDEPLGLPPTPADNPADPARKLLGPEQRQWLFDNLDASSATWKFLGQQVMFGQLKVVGIPSAAAVPGLSLVPVAGNGGQYLNGDQWDGYQAERSAVFAHLADKGIDNVVVLTGDIHTSWAMDLTPDPNNPVAYNPLTGAGSLAVEYVCTSVTSPGSTSWCRCRTPSAWSIPISSTSISPRRATWSSTSLPSGSRANGGT